MRVEDVEEVSAELSELGEAFGSGVEDVVFELEGLLSVDGGEDGKFAAYLPSWGAKELQSVRTGHEERHTFRADDADGFGVALELFEVESGDVEGLELVGRVYHIL
jgi:hypothetical protein